MFCESGTICFAVYNTTEGKVQLTEEERQRVLDEVERQQTEFGIEK